MKKLLCFLLAICLIFPITVSVPAVGGPKTARPSVNGRLHVDGTQLVDSSGKAVQLKGISTHGLTWFPDFVNEKLFRQVSEDWDGNLVRLAMYASIYAGEEREKSYELMCRGIEAAKAADLYVLVDWHMLEKNNPNDQLAEAKEFFERITSDYPDCPNLLFEICNEPNGEADWGDVTDYANQVIPLIRKNIPEADILVGNNCKRDIAGILEKLDLKVRVLRLEGGRIVAFGTPEQIRDIFVELSKHGTVMGTRASENDFAAVRERLPEAEYHEAARIIVCKSDKDADDEPIGNVAVVSAGTADIPVAEEAAVTAETLGNEVTRIYDVGVSGIHRLFDKLEEIRRADVVIVVAGMEGALASVIGMEVSSRPFS